MAKTTLSANVLENLSYRAGQSVPTNEIVSAELGVWLTFKGTSGKLQIIPTEGTDFSNVIRDFKRKLRIFTHILAEHYDGWTLTNHSLPEPKDTLASDLGVASSTRFAHNTAIVLEKGVWMDLRSDGTKIAAEEIQIAYHTMVNWFIGGDSVVIRIPQFPNHASYMKSVDETLHAGGEKVWEMYQEKIEESKAGKEAWRVQKPFVQNDLGAVVGVTPKSPKLVVVALDGTSVDMFLEPTGKVFGVYAAGTFMFPLTWQPKDELVMEGWAALAEAKYLRVGDPQ